MRIHEKKTQHTIYIEIYIHENTNTGITHSWNEFFIFLLKKTCSDISFVILQSMEDLHPDCLSVWLFACPSLRLSIQRICRSFHLPKDNNIHLQATDYETRRSTQKELSGAKQNIEQANNSQLQLEEAAGMSPSHLP